jgi:hypothetical protein
MDPKKGSPTITKGNHRGEFVTVKETPKGSIETDALPLSTHLVIKSECANKPQVQGMLYLKESRVRRVKEGWEKPGRG